MSRLLNDVNMVNQTFGQTIAQMLGNTFSLFGIIIAMLLINFKLALLSNLASQFNDAPDATEMPCFTLAMPIAP